MWRNRAAYGAVVVCAVLFYSFYFGYLSFFFLILTALLPVLSLLYSLPLFWKCTATLSAPSKTVIGRETFWKTGVTAHGVLPVVKWKIAVVNCSNPGGVKKEARVVRASGKDPVLWAVDTTHCGILQCTVESVWGCDLLGLFRFRMKRPLPVTLAVLPQPECPKPVPQMPDLALSRSMVPKRDGGSAEDYELREYRPGDLMRMVHWKRSAQTGDLIVREPLEPRSIYASLSFSISPDAEEMDSVLGQLYWLSRRLLRLGVRHLIVWSCAGDGKKYAAQLELGEDLEQLLLLLLHAPADETCAKRAQTFTGQVDWHYEIRPRRKERTE